MLATGAAVREVLCVFGEEVTTVRTGGWMGVAVGSSYGSAVGSAVGIFVGWSVGACKALVVFTTEPHN
jgi:hypothetical protein